MTLEIPKDINSWMRWIERRLSAQEVRRVGGRTGLIAYEKASRSVTFATATSVSISVTFTAGRFTSAPNVHTNINSTSAVAAGWNSRATAITTSGFTLLVFGPSAAWANIPVQWTAFQ